MHGDGLKHLSLRVNDTTDAWKQTTKRGAISSLSPVTLHDEFGEVMMSGIRTYGDTVHLFIERKNYQGAFLPGYVE